MHLFTYGTLMFPAVWRRVVGREFPRSAAELPGYALFQVRGDFYPVMVPSDASSIVRGVVMHDLDEQATRVLDAYESTIYERRTIQAVLQNGDPLTCHAYVLCDARLGLRSEDPWDATWFERHALDAYLRRFD